MILPSYQVKKVEESKSRVIYNIIFDKVIVVLSGDAKHSGLDINFIIKDGCRRRNVNLLKYLNAVNDFLISNNHVCFYEERYIDILNPLIVKRIGIERLRISSGEMEYISECFPNLLTLETKNCTIYDKANVGALKCNYRDFKSDIISLDSFNGFSGRSLFFQNSCIRNNNKNMLHLYNIILKFYNVNIDYEMFMLMADAPNLRKIEINRFRNKLLTNNDLLFISGFYNLESINIDAIINSLDSIRKLERLRKLYGIYLDNSSAIENTKKIRQKYYYSMKYSGKTEEELKNYLMFQSIIIHNKYLDLLNELYIKRLDRVKWQDKFNTNDIERIKKELIQISEMSYRDRKNISREIKEFTLEDQLDDLWFDKIKEKKEDEYLVNSRPFESGGIDFYVKSKKLTLEE